MFGGLLPAPPDATGLSTGGTPPGAVTLLLSSVLLVTEGELKLASTGKPLEDAGLGLEGVTSDFEGVASGLEGGVVSVCEGVTSDGLDPCGLPPSVG